MKEERKGNVQSVAVLCDVDNNKRTKRTFFLLGFVIRNQKTNEGDPRTRTHTHTQGPSATRLKRQMGKEEWWWRREKERKQKRERCKRRDDGNNTHRKTTPHNIKHESKSEQSNANELKALWVENTVWRRKRKREREKCRPVAENKRGGRKRGKEGRRERKLVRICELSSASWRLTRPIVYTTTLPTPSSSSVCVAAFLLYGIKNGSRVNLSACSVTWIVSFP